MRILLNLLSAVYNEALESFCTRLLYFFNTINTYFLVAGLAAFFLVQGPQGNLPAFLAGLVLAAGCARLADFHPLFLAFALPGMTLAGAGLVLEPGFLLRLALANVAMFALIQVLFMGIPDSIVARDPSIPVRKLWLSMTTVAPTTVSFSMSVFFSGFLGFWLAAADRAAAGAPLGLAALGAGLTLAGALATRLALPRNRFSRFHKPDIPETPLAQRVVILNIDGCRKDVYDALDLPTRNRIMRRGASHAHGLRTVYRALTNPAFASIFTGTVPAVHGVRDNNLGQSIKVEGLPDVVPAIAYGSMHVKHFSKPEWETRIVSLPRHSVYQSDDIMVQWLREDLKSRPEVRLFVADFSEADFLGHAYGSTSAQYAQALERIDARIGDFLDWMAERGLDRDTVVVVCSDHGIAGIDHSYLIAASERYVPFMLLGPGVRAGQVMEQPGTVMDICCTVAWLLGVRYPARSRGRVATECMEGVDAIALERSMVERLNALRYDAEAATYSRDHVEVVEGDAAWWDAVLARHVRPGARPQVLDLGCGDGFVGRRFRALGLEVERFVCCDLSTAMLERAREHLGDGPGMSYVQGLDGVEGSFELMAANSVFHHLADTRGLAARLDALLAPGGMLVGAHEPDRTFFAKASARLAATTWKRLGGGMSMAQEAVRRVNEALQRRCPRAPKLCAEEILQMSEYHSPLEQWENGVDPGVGFDPPRFLAEHFPGWEVVELESYTTFFHRPRLCGHPWARWLLETAFGLAFGGGNLFRYAVRKPKG